MKSLLFLMMKTINFCGDSFCMNESEKSWCVILAKKLNAKIVGFGKGGTAHEHAIKSFNPKADINIFCWTEYNRVYHKKYLLNFNNVDKNINQKNKVYAAAKVYYKYLHDYTYAKERQYRDLYWFDHEILSLYKRNILHYYCFEINYKFKNGQLADTSFEDLYPTSDSKLNHFSEFTNIKLAQYSYNLLQNF